jgi:hypothetical protein
MRLYLSLLVAFLSLTNAAFGGVGDVGVSEGSTSIQPSSSYAAGAAQPDGYASMTLGSKTSENQVGSTGYSIPLSGSTGQEIQTPQIGSLQSMGGPYAQSISSTGQNYPSVKSGLQANQQFQANSISASAFGAPQMSGPYEEHFSPDELKLSQPQAEGFQPEGSLNFASANPPGNMLADTSSTYSTLPSAATGSSSGTMTGGGAWYYPGSVSSRNKFYVQTSSGFKTVAGCNYGGYVPLWANIASSDNFYVYEWYPGKTSPYVRWWGWTWPGWKKGWFSGDVPGWHILCYYCRDASNYVYIYVWPSRGSAGSTGSGYGEFAQVSQPQTQTLGEMPSGAPTPPDPNAESLMLPDFNMVSQGQSSTAAQIYSTVFPRPTAYRCNEYYIQTWPGKLNTVGSVKCGEWLPLWSKIGQPGCYWSYEWAQGCASLGGFCYPEVKNFGSKGTGWYSTWFRGNKPGWHVLTYYIGDWSNYIYIYVWPSN